MLNDEGHVRCPATSAGQPETRLVVNLARVRSYFRCAFGDLGEGPEFRQSWVVHAKGVVHCYPTHPSTEPEAQSRICGFVCGLSRLQNPRSPP